jgi:hypothetical protein
MIRDGAGAWSERSALLSALGADGRGGEDGEWVTMIRCDQKFLGRDPASAHAARFPIEFQRLEPASEELVSIATKLAA